MERGRHCARADYAAAGETLREAVGKPRDTAATLEPWALLDAIELASEGTMLGPKVTVDLEVRVWCKLQLG